MVKDKKVKLSVGIAVKGDLFLKSFSALLTSLGDYNVLAEGRTGKDLMKALKKAEFLPLVCIVDINVPDSYKLVSDIKLMWPKVKVLVLSNAYTEYAAYRMIYYGANGFLSKQAPVTEMVKAINEVFKKGVYYSKEYSKEVFDKANNKEIATPSVTDRQLELLQYCLTTANYSEIAKQMEIGVRGVDTLKETLFKKFKVKNRTDLVMLALKSGLVSYD
jgi:two-component system, NarL family, invasion response regulator UvrY